ncbi:MAG TPA: glutamine amidotransferase family protein [Spirochaetota bacterium]|mgnify:CR=1 FL=1|nr:glutamine amidotransferase family protein [Spirochaetota bacterium]HNT10017.1 glutamine amidotransferase family protein [Spirochaetota bacterium]HNV46892.1 glutamine amidotransferase family protein [Spirochaetota bacterium]HOS39714.1 glutamine amidotransferase family protein [Spirochaetota bacterium]HPI22151.1 glutamine amidotransferase family protein [Spirochaetota bacterium]
MCGIVGIINTDRRLIDGSHIREAIRIQRDRGNGLGGGFAAYGIYPENKDQYAFHLMYEGDRKSPIVAKVEAYLQNRTRVYQSEEIPVYPNDRVAGGPYFKRYFVKPLAEEIRPDQSEEDYIVETVMFINRMGGAFVVSSGKNMGAFKGVGYPEDIADYFHIQDYKAYMWTAHNRFPTNTPGWWGGAHPFTILDKAVVHNGEITSYGTNMRYLEMFGYFCLLQTDTEVISYIFDKLTRKDGLSRDDACFAMAPALWEEIDRIDDRKKKKIRQVYGAAVVNGPFGIVLTHKDGAIILNDRNKLRPVVCARTGNTWYASSEECSIRLLSPEVDELWSPKGGEPVLIELGADTGTREVA